MEPITNQTVQQTPPKKKSLSQWAMARKKFIRNIPAMASLIFLLVVTALSMASPLLSDIDPSRINPKLVEAPPSAEHWLGADSAGRDIVTMLLYGGRTSLLIGFSCTAIIIFIATLIGTISGYYGNKIDSILMRFTDFMMNFPFLIFVIVLQAIFVDSGVLALILVISLLSWTGAARVIRSKVMSEKENEYVLSAVSIGTKPSKVMIKHILPNVISTIIVQATLLLAAMIVAETGLSYLGFGVPVGTPSWGNMLQAARDPGTFENLWWVWLPPGLLITLTILSINFIGEGFKDAFNPKTKK
ncbi:ABC transporter permease [Virgibacillus pantothenticus]|uniref:oligopeptide ABC transporter permease n=1 Tax=Virgibacillus TaxID=84406 RepID=UPI00090B443B|nr:MULTISPECIES: oligopeptide ABC transporter permease [Virgibacillus]API92267.1 peptide ABC transporter permease [Virgibacillus sp. 6R]MBS7427134.1 ABC transporter permease [Virgibacillus sp. 19R1-5]MBU8567511.1 ABC transporter permease [Virgibacillus pantothenticus]MBU8601127.1 ABC transporter permease [Virgibacillus pantothenticus]MBU8635477.1 ABC transporter permease [Virgibacillus pantothenticus]